jgi:hypothetical protein
MVGDAAALHNLDHAKGERPNDNHQSQQLWVTATASPSPTRTIGRCATRTQPRPSIHSLINSLVASQPRINPAPAQ